MNVPEGFKQTEVGVIPQDWEVTELWQLADFLDGQRKPIKSSDRDKMKGIYPYYGASGIIAYVNNYIFDDELILLGEDGENILSRNLRLAFIVRGKVWVNNHAHVLKAKDGCSTAFLAEKLESLNYEQYNSGTAQPKITKGTCAKIKISLPPTKAEQTAIAAALSDMDALIEGVEKLLEKKRRIKQGAMQELLRPKEGWTKKALGEVLKIKHGKSQKDVASIQGSYPILASGGIIGKANDYLYNKPSVLIGRKGTIDEPQYMDSPFWAVDTLFYSEILTGNSEKFIFYLFRLIDWYAYNEASGVPSLNAKTIENIEKYFPELEKQTAIAAILSDMDSEIEQLETQLTKYRQLKTGMMQELLTGKKRLV